MSARSFFLIFFLFFLFFLMCVSCGIDDYMYLEPVPSGNIRTELITRAEIRLPSVDTSQFYYFRYFALYYRIYTSVNDFAAISPNEYSSLNPSLSSDYNAFLPYTNNTGTSNAGTIGSLFRNRRYWTLFLEGANIESELNQNGRTVTLSFSSSNGADMALDNGTPYPLLRSNDGGSFVPAPDRYFRNSSELRAAENATTLKNADVAAVSGGTYAFAALYIVAVGMDNNYSPIYSTPAFVGVFRLP
jgi:hypothetical protein